MVCVLQTKGLPSLGETEKNRKEQEQEAKKRKKEEEKKKREAKQLQRKEQLLALQKQHQSARKHQSLTDEELSDSDDEYLPVWMRMLLTANMKRLCK